MSEGQVYGVESGVDFPVTLVNALVTWSNGDMTALGRMTVFLNSDRMRRKVKEAFGQKGAFLLPRLLLVTEVDQLLLPGTLPPARDALRQRLELAQLVQSLIEADPTLAPRASAYDLADTLVALLDEMATEGVAPDGLEKLNVDDESGHWLRSLSFLTIVRQFLADAEDPTVTSGQRLRMAVDALTAQWNAAPPKDPVIVAGSTGSRGTTAALIRAVGQLKLGKIVVPGFDSDTPNDVVDTIAQPGIAEDHPQARIAALVADLGKTWDEVISLGAKAPAPDRNRLVSLALRPAPVTDQWLRDGPKLADMGKTCQDITLLEAPSPRIEAEATALFLRQAIEAGKSVAVITPDRIFTRQLETALERWKIQPDDSAGKPLHLSPPGRLIRLISQSLGQDLTPLGLLTLLTHPLTCTSDARGPHLLNCRKLELALRRRGAPFIRSGDMPDLAAEDVPEVWSTWVDGILAAFVTPPQVPLSERLAHIQRLAECLAAGPDSAGSGDLWEQSAGRATLDVLSRLQNAASAVPVITIPDTRYLLETALSAETVRQPDVAHPDVMIWGTLEARVQGADVVVLAGLNDGIWPAQPAADPWLNRRLRQQAGLLLPDRQIGLSAHDFQQAMGAKEIVITRSVRDTEAETVPSRWLNRLLNLIAGLPDKNAETALKDMRKRGQRWVYAAEHQDLPSQTIDAAARPSPAPPHSARPRTLSITDIGRLIRDPYAVYANRVLGLRQLDPLVPLPDAAVRGSVLHKIMERFVQAVSDGDIALDRDNLMRVTEDVLQGVAWPSTAVLWRARIARITDVFVQAEMFRREGVTQSLVEVRGQFCVPDTPVTLVGTADRIDLRDDGRVAIYDYKSGGVKSASQMQHFEPQLLLEALMVEAGGFEKLEALTAAKIGYISLSRDAKANAFPLEDGPDYDFRVDTTRTRLSQLVKAFLEDSQGFTSRRAMTRVRFEGDYDHLARAGEWDDTAIPVHQKVGA